MEYKITRDTLQNNLLYDTLEALSKVTTCNWMCMLLAHWQETLLWKYLKCRLRVEEHLILMWLLP